MSAPLYGAKVLDTLRLDSLEVVIAANRVCRVVIMGNIEYGGT